MYGESDSEKLKRFFRAFKEIALNKKTILFVLFLLILANAVYIFFYYSKPCGDFECFKTAMEKCSRANYINEETEATWKYAILGNSEGGSCLVNVKMLQAKEGELGINRLIGYDMDCSIMQSVGTYPNKDLNKCHGRLKEELQAIVIEKLHVNILENLEGIKEGVSGAL